jgi:hypothetical protein
MSTWFCVVDLWTGKEVEMVRLFEILSRHLNENKEVNLQKIHQDDKPEAKLKSMT